MVSLVGCLVLTGACKPGEQREAGAQNHARSGSQQSAGSEGEVIVNDAYRFSVRLPGPGWRELDEQTSRGLNPLAAVVVADGKGGTGMVTVETMPGATLEDVTRIAWNPELFRGELESESELEYQGRPAKRRIYQVPVRKAGVRIVHTIFIHQDHIYQVISGGPASLDLELPMRFQASFVLLEGEVDGQPQVLASSPETEQAGRTDAARGRRFEGQRSVYGGVFRDFEHAATWTVPAGSWDVLALGASELTSRHTVLHVEERELGLNGLFEMIDTQVNELEEVFAKVVADKFVEERGIMTGDGVTFEWVRAHREGSPSTLFLFALGLREGGMVSWSLQADYESADQHEAIVAMMTAAVEGTRLLPELPPTSEAEGVFIDHQYGVSLRPPPGFERKDVANEGSERRVNWSDGKRELELWVIRPKARDPEAVLDLFELSLEANEESHLVPVEHGEFELGGRKARRLRSPDHRVEVDIVAFEGGRLYGLISRELSEGEHEAARTSLRFLE